MPLQVVTVRSDGCLSFGLLDDGEAAIIDPSRDTAKYRTLLAERGAKLRYAIDTHTHADHLSGARKLADETGARLVMSEHCEAQWAAAAGKADALGIGDVLRANAGVHVDHLGKDGETLRLGGSELRMVQTPGHTLDALSVAVGHRLFTGDTLLIGQTGRCDLPGGDGGALYDTLHAKLGAVPDETFVYPGHDYDGRTVTALGLERASSPFLKPRSRAEFVEFLKTAFPTLTGAGMQCGASAVGAAAASCATDGRPADPLRDEVAGFMDAYFFSAEKSPLDVVSVSELDRALQERAELVLLDVREPQEWERGHIAGATRISVHELDRRLREVPATKTSPIVTICRSGKRSGWAAMFLRVAGFPHVRSLEGGIQAWEKAGLPTATGGGKA